MNIHKKRKHQINTVCEICEKRFNSTNDLKLHTYTHSYTSKGDIGQTCKKCNFACDTIESMEVHLGKCNVEEFECGLCETTFKTEEEIDTHLTTCEVYECGECCLRYTTLDVREGWRQNYSTVSIIKILAYIFHHLRAACSQQ